MGSPLGSLSTQRQAARTCYAATHRCPMTGIDTTLVFDPRRHRIAIIMRHGRNVGERHIFRGNPHTDGEF